MMMTLGYLRGFIYISHIDVGHLIAPNYYCGELYARVPPCALIRGS